MGHQYMYKSQALRSSTTLGQIVIYLLSTAATASISAIYAPVIVSTAPHLRGWAGIIIFTFQSPGISPALWGQADGNNLSLCPTLHNRKSQQGKCPNVITSHTSPALRRQSKSNWSAPHSCYSTAIPVGGGRGCK